MKLNRRSFIAAGAATVIASRVKAAPSIRDANDRIGICTIGFNGQGGSHIKDILKMTDEAEYVAICDVDSDVLERGAKMIEESQGKRPRTYRDIREALADKEVDAVTIATPNHWHSLATVWACEAGKDVYVEKPLSHNFSRGSKSRRPLKSTGKSCSMAHRVGRIRNSCAT
jgi:predicted dehydrogenase